MTGNPESDEIHKAIALLNVDWGSFSTLFLNVENYPIFQATGAAFWKRTQAIMLDSVILSISRLMDPPKTGKADNLSLARLIEAPILDAVRPDLVVEYEKLRTLWQSVLKSRRDKHISHSDMEARLGVRTSVHYADVSKMIQGVTELWSRLLFELHYVVTQNVYTLQGDASDVLSFLKAGIDALEVGDQE